ncbi:MAG TPA: quinol:electron acceptor oxidoreductase subunit ActD [Vicinamibacterales bacterium]|nr:quinol:electron acceptor oxidoreductase subunit ActD [Vicinamibacterales bacterium]
MKAVYGLYDEGRSAQRAVDALRAADIADRDITVISGQPMEDFEFGRAESANWLWWFACAGGLAGMILGYGLTWLAQNAWPIEGGWPITVGGMPKYSWWPSLIIIFELTMLGAIVTTAVALLITAGLPGWREKLYDPAVTDGKILVGVENPPEASVAAIERALSAAPGTCVKSL